MLSFGKKFPRISYKDIAEATRNFSELNLIGRGSYGSVYRGKLTLAKIQVAIKVFDLGIQCADRSFLSECEALRAIKHRNIVPILTACSTIDNKGNDFRALVYEFMSNGNLDTWLHHRCAGVAPKYLTLAQRISIAVGIADALAYLHNDCGRPIIHCDLKPTNILLDDDMNAHLGDFGISRLLRDFPSTTLGHSGSNGSVTVKGTIGYISPEYAQSVHASTCGDVYTFGIVLLEMQMLIGKRPTDSMFEGEMNIVSFVEKNFPKQMSHIIDAHLQEECMSKRFLLARVERGNEVHQCLMSLVGIALSCTRLLPSQRMNMRQVAANLNTASYAIQQLPSATVQGQIILR
ncbi:probable LRR receptor-like serine/threonine-protein kinase At3g47570 [Sorghum bicolor]|uniref:probable LRR receptor-like serine/threonine-protein kinase At3g47570 n=1 Tax=Sorghum bicolor TaxID=4558 RepID=UPI000B4258C4|nr:probable LRR receptor-like serine/threonine-protein kinase At3g47570 [Sorghum bicolor]|eukprot:XP_021315242.1 probable LRR receptor-like serine/threonine-protein kinase At3g47570 [Sorghum bicolor]